MSLDKYYVSTYGQNALKIYRKSKDHYDNIVGTTSRKNSQKKINKKRNSIFMENQVKGQHRNLQLKNWHPKKHKNSANKQEGLSNRKKQRYSYCSVCSPSHTHKQCRSTTKKIQKMIKKLQQKTNNKLIHKTTTNMSSIQQLEDILKNIEIPKIMHLLKNILQKSLVSIASLQQKVCELEELNKIYQKSIELLNNRLAYQKQHHYSLHRQFQLPKPQNQRQFTLLTHIDTLQKQLQIYRHKQENLFTAINMYTEKQPKNVQSFSSHHIQQNKLQQ